MSPKCVLTVDDDPDGRAVVKGLLEQINISSDAVGTAEEGLHYLDQYQYDAVVIDLALPHQDGFFVLQTIRENPATANLPCIVITAYHDSLVRKQAFEAGCNHYFSKPIDDSAFLRAMATILA